MTKKERAQEILKRLRATYERQEDTFVRWSNPLELVVATVLSAQCTDKRVNIVTQPLFKKYTTAKKYANADLRTLEKEIGSVTYFRSKARYLKGIGELLVKKHNGAVPLTRDELVALPGVGLKTANLIMAKGHNTNTGIAVDTHVKRVMPRLGLTKHTTPEKIARDLEKLFPKEDYLDVNEFSIMHGRAICLPRKPKCGECPLQDICPSAKAFLKKMAR